MKKFITILLTLIVVLALYACTNSQSTQSEDPALPTTIEQNPMLISMGNEITINGKIYTAAMLYETRSGFASVDDDGIFVVNRINGQLFLYTSSYTYKGNCVNTWTDLHLTYEGTVTIAGVEIQIPEAVNEIGGLY